MERAEWLLLMSIKCKLLAMEGDFTRAIKEGLTNYSGINLCFLILSCLIFESSVERGIPSFAAAPSGPATFPLLSARAVSIISLS